MFLCLHYLFNGICFSFATYLPTKASNKVIYKPLPTYYLFLLFKIGIIFPLKVSSFMIRSPRIDPEGTVDLLDKDQTHQLMWIRHFSKRDLSIASFHDGFAES